MADKSKSETESKAKAEDKPERGDDRVARWPDRGPNRSMKAAQDALKRPVRGPRPGATRRRGQSATELSAAVIEPTHEDPIFTPTGTRTVVRTDFPGEYDWDVMDNITNRRAGQPIVTDFPGEYDYPAADNQKRVVRRDDVEVTHPAPPGGAGVSGS